MYLQSAEIQNFHGIRHLSIDFEKDTTVLIGENAWGKSSLLCALFMVLGQGHDKLCSFSKDDLYIPIKIANEDDEESDEASQDTDDAPQNATQTIATTKQPVEHIPSVKLENQEQCCAYLHNKGLEGIEPIKVINTPAYQRRYYSVPNAYGAGRVLHIVDFPCTPNPPFTDRYGRPTKNSARYKNSTCPSTNKRRKNKHHNHDDKRPLSRAFDNFIDSHKAKSGPVYEPRNHVPITIGSDQDNEPITVLAPKHTKATAALGKDNLANEARSTPAKKSIFEAIRTSLDAEAQYEKEQPLYYTPSSKERVARAQYALDNQNELNSEGLASAKEDLKFFSSDIFKAEANGIVLDLVFCEGDYGLLNKIERFACLKPVAYLGDDGRYRIHYRISASFVSNEHGSQDFVTTHQLLNEKEQPYPDSENLIKELILLNPLLRLRDRRMYKPGVSASPSMSPSLSPERQGQVDNDKGNEINYRNQAIESEAYQAISHFFANITTDEDLNSARMQDAIEVLNTIASKYLINYQSNYSNEKLHVVANKPRTAREIISHPVSIASLGTLKAAVADEKPSRSKLLLSLLAGALLMSKGQREIDEYSRPILILEDIESRFHPTLLLNLWSILQVLPIQKIVTTNSSQLLSAISLHNVRRLCKQYYDVRCYRIRDKAFSVDDERKIAFHIRMSRPGALFARCWILVEGETEVWLLNEIASVLGINLACSGIKLVEFAQCGLHPLIKLARQIGINYHVLTDGDDAGRHYAQTVRDFVGSRNLPDHLSVMPHVDIEHYFYTSGFADVYQKAANIELQQHSAKRPPNFIASLNLQEFVEPQDKEKDASYKETPPEELEKAPKMANINDFNLRNHNLDSVIKSVLAFNVDDSSATLEKIIKRGKVQGRAKKAQLFEISEMSKGDVTLLYQYLTGLIMDMPRSYRGLSKKQNHLLDVVKKLRVTLLKQVNRNEQRISQLRRNFLKQLSAKERKAKENLLHYSKVHGTALDLANFPEQGHTPTTKALPVQDQRPDNTTETKAPQSPDKAGNKTGEFVLSMGEKMSLEEQNKSLDQLKALAAKAIVTETDLAKAKNFERSTGKATNAIYGALDEQALSKKGLSINRVISLAIHKKTKPGLAILIGEAMAQRGENSVPLLFRTMFCKLKRLSQNESGLD